MAKIGEILISEGHLTQEGLEEALDWQVLYGGRLGTNLLELQLVTEEQLAHALGRQMGAEVAFGDLDPDPSLVGLVPKYVADRQEIVPWRVEKRRLKVLCCAIDVAQFDQLSTKVGRPCVPVIAPEFRVFQLLRAHYGATRQMRALDFGVVPEEGLERRRKKEKQKGQKEAEPAQELIDENAFNDIYNQILAGRSSLEAGPQRDAGQPAPTWQTQPPRPAGPPVIAPIQPPAPERREPPPPVQQPQPAQQQAPQQPEPVETLEALPDDAILGEAVPEPQPEAAPQPQHAAWEEAPPAPARDESPLDFKEALRALEGVTDRDSIAHIVLRASRSKAARALLLQVQAGVALGWDGLGEGTENARAVAIPLSAESAFALVARTRSHYMGPLQKTPLNIRFLATLGKKVPLSSLLFPILHKGRVTHMLYLDNCHRQQAPTDVGEMLILSQRISQTVEALVARKRKAARG